MFGGKNRLHFNEQTRFSTKQRTSSFKNIKRKLYISGAETAAQNPGYMDGAIFCCKTIASTF
jgi:monoamine oxidase